MFREVSVIEVREMLRVWMLGAGLRRVGALAGVDRKTARRYTDAAVEAGLDRDGSADQLTDELISAVVEAVRTDRPHGYGAAWEMLCASHDRIEKWVGQGLTVVKIVDLLAREAILQDRDAAGEILDFGDSALEIGLPELHHHVRPLRGMELAGAPEIIGRTDR